MEPTDYLRGAARRHVGIVRRGLGDFEAGVVGHIVLQHVENETFFYGLPHRVNVERAETAVFLLRAEHFQRCGLRRGGEGEKGQVLVPPVGDHLPHQLVLRVDFLLRFSLDLRVLPERVLSVRQRRFQLQGCGSRLRRMGLVHDDGEILALRRLHFLINHRKLLQRRHDDPRPVVQRPQKVLARLPLADGLHRAQRVVKAGNCFLQLRVQHRPVRHHHHALENCVARPVVERRQAVRRPRDGVRLARARRVLDQVIVPRAVLQDMGNHLPHRVELMVARENQPFLCGRFFRAVCREFLFLGHLEMDEFLQNIHHAVFLENGLPKVRRRIAVFVRRVALAAVPSRAA